MSTYDLHKGINIVKNTIGYNVIRDAIENSMINSGYTIKNKTMYKSGMIVAAGEKINGDPNTVLIECFSDLICEHHNKVSDALNESGFINGYIDGDILPSVNSMFFVIPIPDSSTYEILF